MFKVYLLVSLSENEPEPADPLRMRVLMLNPKVGETPETSSSFSFLRIVVFPALSRPLLVSAEARHVLARWQAWATDRKRILISFDFALFFRMMVRRPEGVSFNGKTALYERADPYSHTQRRLLAG